MFDNVFDIINALCLAGLICPCWLDERIFACLAVATVHVLAKLLARLRVLLATPLIDATELRGASQPTVERDAEVILRLRAGVRILEAMSDSVSTFKVRVVGDGVEEAAVTSNCVLALGPF